MLIIQQFKTYRGHWCRDCGLSRFRQVQAQTLLLGWWGFISFFANLVNVAQNIGVYNSLNNLGTPVGRVRAPMPAGRSVFISPGFVVGLCLLGFVAFNILF